MSEEDFVTAIKIKAYLMEQGTPIGKKDGDIFIAAYCIVNDYTLVTDNTRDFSRIDGLKYVNWKEWLFANCFHFPRSNTYLSFS